MDKVRIDKWLWSARFFKSRSLSATAVSSHKVKVNGEQVKPARYLLLDDELEIVIEDTRFIIIVKGLSEQRRPAPEARMLYAETEDSITRRAAEQELRRLAPVPGSNLKGRPTKREGRLIRGVLGE